MGDVFDGTLGVDSAGLIHFTWRDTNEYGGSGSDTDIYYRSYDPSFEVLSTIAVVSTESDNTSDNPRFCIDTQGVIHVVWQDFSDYDSSGLDYDVFYKKFVGAPIAPELLPIVPAESETGEITLLWTAVDGATEYLVYRDVSYITALTGFEDVSRTTDNSYVDSLVTNDIYYYAVVASNQFGNSTISNIEYVEVLIPDEPLPTNTTGNFIIPTDLLIVGGVIVGLQVLFFALGAVIRKK